MKKIQKILTAVSFSVVLAVFTVVGFYSFFDKDEKVSEMENRNLAQKPSFPPAHIFQATSLQSLKNTTMTSFPAETGSSK